MNSKKFDSLLVLVIFGAFFSLVSCSSAEKKAADSKASDMKKTSEKAPAKKGKMSLSDFKGDSFTCKGGSDERKLVKREVAGGGCEVAYTKNGATEIVATAQNDLTYCTQVVNRIRSKLENAGFACTMP